MRQRPNHAAVVPRRLNVPGGRRPARAATGAALALVLVAGCSAAAEKPYVFQPANSPVKVDTPALRAQKAAAGIRECPRSSPGATAKPGGLPAISLPCLGGGRDVDLAGLTGTPMVVNFWAQSCGPCREESPILQQVYQAGRDRLRIIGVDWEDSQPDMAIEFASQLGLTYPQLADPDAVTRSPLHIAGLPVSLFVDASGTIVHAEYGAIGSADELTRLVSRFLGVDVRVGGGS